jgi:V-type H+-transporting ATPase 16kDa proteolipid subunit
VSAELLTGIGAAMAVFLSSMGSCIAFVPAGQMALHSPGLFLAFGPVIISGVLAIYGSLLAAILVKQLRDNDISQIDGFKNFSAGLTVGLACLASGLAMAGFLHNSMNKGNQHDPRRSETEPFLVTSQAGAQRHTQPSVRMMTVLVFAEAIGLYGLIVAVLLVV